MKNIWVEKVNYAKNGFEFYVNKYMELFCEKHELVYDKDLWIDFAEIIDIGDMFINFSDIRTDIDKNVKKGVFTEWYWANMESESKFISYNSWLKGFRH